MDRATIRLNNFCDKIDDSFRRIVFTFTLTFSNGELAEAVFIYTTDEIILGLSVYQSC